MMKRKELTYEDFPKDMAELTATQYTRLLQYCAMQQETLDSTRDRLDHRRDEADRDLLTGLWNRRGLERRTKARDWGWWVAIDLNGFKAAQDEHDDGHAYGDRILVEFSAFVSDITRRDDITGRVGGDEFLIWTETREAAMRIRDTIRWWKSRDDRVTASAGLGDIPETAETALYMYKGKINTSRSPKAPLPDSIFDNAETQQ